MSTETLDKLPEESVTIGDLRYAKDDLKSAFRKADLDENGQVVRSEWRNAQAHNWPPIWLWPGALAAVVCIIFLIGGRDVKTSSPEEKGADEGENA